MLERAQARPKTLVAFRLEGICVTTVSQGAHRTLAVLRRCPEVPTLAVLLRPQSEDLFVEGPSVRSAPHLCADHDFSGLAGGVTQFSRFALDSPSEHFSSFAPKVSYFSTTTPG